MTPNRLRAHIHTSLPGVDPTEGTYKGVPLLFHEKGHGSLGCQEGRVSQRSCVLDPHSSLHELGHLGETIADGGGEGYKVGPLHTRYTFGVASLVPDHDLDSG